MKYFCSIVITLLTLLLFSKICFAAVIENPISYTIKQTATIGESKLTLYGYTGAQARVILSGTAVNDEVKADDSGYFEFQQILLPKLSQNPELCLFSVDANNLISFPVCIPPLPLGPFLFEVGPVLLAPTIQIDKGLSEPTEQIKAQGTTIPGAIININLANNLTTTTGFNLIKPAFAYALPEYQATADSQGRFEFNLPVEQSQWQIYATAQFKGSPTPKSNSLMFQVLSPLQNYYQEAVSWLGRLLTILSPDHWLLIILLEILLILLLVWYSRHLRQNEKLLMLKLRILKKNQRLH